MRFQGKQVLVTGAASGIGRATAIRFASEGASVTIGDVNEAGLQKTAEMMDSAPRIQPFDATDFESCRALVATAAADGLDVLCNISGMLKWGPSTEFAVEDFERILKINTTSVFVLCQAALPHLIKSKGNIVNTASTAALQGIAYTIAYSASKHGVAAITKGLAVEFAAKGVRINAICPGTCETPMVRQAIEQSPDHMARVIDAIPLGRVGKAEEIASMVLLLCSDYAGFAIGQTWAMDGGYTAM